VWVVGFCVCLFGVVCAAVCMGVVVVVVVV